MNTPNPLVPQGTLERHSKGKSTVRIAIFTIVSIHAVFFAGLLMQGCRHDENKNVSKSTEPTNSLPPLENAAYYAPTQEVANTSTTAPLPTTSPPASTTVAEIPTLAPTPPAPVEPASEAKPYKVAKGDTLLKIAKANGITVNALAKANPTVEPSKLKVGQTIQIPAASAVAASTGLGFAEPGKSDSSSTASKGSMHKVKPGETLTKIAKLHGTTVRALRAANDLKTDRLVVGQVLKLPVFSAASASTDTVKASSVSKLTATNPAHVNPLSSNADSMR
jgi:LysM repeat protein